MAADLVFQSNQICLHRHPPLDDAADGKQPKPLMHLRVFNAFAQTPHALLIGLLVNLLDKLEGTPSDFEWVVDLRAFDTAAPLWVAGFAMSIPPHLSSQLHDAIEGASLLTHPKVPVPNVFVFAPNKRPRFIGPTPPARLAPLLRPAAPIPTPTCP